MGTLLLSCVCDSIAAKLCGGCRCVTEIHEAGTNCHDVCIVFVICVAIVLVALIAKCAICSWKNAEIDAADKERKEKEDKEKEDSTRKQKADLLDNYLDFLKENASKDDKWIHEYKSTLGKLIDLLKKKDKEEREKKEKNTIENTIDYEVVLSILKEQFEFLKNMVSNSNAEAEKEYERVLSYLIEMSQAGKMDKITQKDLLGKRKDDPS